MATTFKKITALLIIATTLTGCGSGQSAVTRNFKQVTDGVEAQTNEIRLRHVLIVKTAASEAVLVGTLVNWSDQSDALTGVSINYLPANFRAQSNQLLKNKPLIFVGESANADAVITGFDKPAGERIEVTFTFANASPVTVDALVVGDDGIYEKMSRFGNLPAVESTTP